MRFPLLPVSRAGVHLKHSPSLTPNTSPVSARADLLVGISSPLPFSARAFPWSVKGDKGDLGPCECQAPIFNQVIAPPGRTLLSTPAPLSFIYQCTYQVLPCSSFSIHHFGQLQDPEQVTESHFPPTKKPGPQLLAFTIPCWQVPSSYPTVISPSMGLRDRAASACKALSVISAFPAKSSPSPGYKTSHAALRCLAGGSWNEPTET